MTTWDDRLLPILFDRSRIYISNLQKFHYQDNQNKQKNGWRLQADVSARGTDAIFFFFSSSSIYGFLFNEQMERTSTRSQKQPSITNPSLERSELEQRRDNAAKFQL